MKPDTFGKYKAGKVLVKILNEENNKVYSSKISRLITDYNFNVNAILYIREIEVIKNCLRLLYNEKKELLLKSSFPTNIKTHTLCVITSVYRDWLKALKSIERR